MRVGLYPVVCRAITSKVLDGAILGDLLGLSIDLKVAPMAFRWVPLNRWFNFWVLTEIVFCHCAPLSLVEERVLLYGIIVGHAHA